MLCCIAAPARADDAPPADNPAANPASASSPSADNPPAPANEIGRSIFVANDVDGKSGDAAPQRIAVNDDIVFEEDITTGDDAKAVIEFRDGSTFEVGPDAAVRIDAFVFNPEESVSHKTVQVTRGVFRYVSGYVASDQDTKIKTPHGAMAIRGSVAEGVVDPDLPDFVFLGEGSATFTNDGGSSELQPGGSIAVPASDVPPMEAAAMPAAVAAEALVAIEKRLPPREVLRNRPAADDAWLKRAGAANLVPAAEQQRFAASVAAGRPFAGPARRGAITGELTLLAEANRINMFRGGPPARTVEQTAFLARTARDNVAATARLRRFTADARILHGASVTAGTALVIRGVGRAAPSADVMRRVTAASVRANPAASVLINRHANESFRGDNRRGGESRQPGHPGDQRPSLHRPTDFERRQPGGNPRDQRRVGTPGEQQRPAFTPRGAAPKPPIKQPLTKQPPAKREPPRKKGDEHENQR